MTMDWPSNEFGFCLVLSVKRTCWMNASVKIATTHSYIGENDSERRAKEEETENEVCFSSLQKKLKYEML